MQYIDKSQNPVLEIGEVHLWSTTLLVGPNELEAYRSTLDPEELNRAGRFRFERDQRRFIAARGQLRLLLGHYADTDPAEIVLSQGAHGKPYLRSPAELMHFNVSHSADKALIAFCPDGPVGVDIEQFKRDTWLAEIADTFCTPRELTWIRSLLVSDRTSALVRLWTAKEAFLKAIGKGLQVPLDEIEISHGPSPTSPGCFRWSADRGMSDFFALHPLSVYERSGYCASLVALKGVACRRLFWHRFKKSRIAT